MNREAFLARVRAALGRSEADAVPPPPPVAPAAMVAPSVDGLGGRELAAHFADRVAASGARLVRVADEPAAVAAAADLVRAAGGSAVADGSAVAATVLAVAGPDAVGADDAADAATASVGVTRAWRGVAETGTVVLRSEAGRRAGVLPPCHIVLVAVADLRPGLTEIYAELGPLPAALVQVTGPSRTADIEMTLVTGVHGPGEVHVLLFG